MVSYTVKQTVVENLNADLDGKQPAGDYPTNASLTESLQSNLFNYTTNRILEIPQDIKLELNNGTLTLKTGSKVYAPNGKNSDGSNKFDVITVESDVQLLSSLTSTYVNGDYSWCYNNNLKKIQGGNNVYKQIQSSTYDGSAQYCMFYDTTNNVIKYTTDTGSTWESGYSLPFCITSLVNGKGNTSINQVFNGFGYIGSTVFMLPNIKFLFTSGVNDKSGYNTTTIINDSVRTYTAEGSTTKNGFFLGCDFNYEDKTLAYFGLYNNDTIVSGTKPNASGVIWFNPSLGYGQGIDNEGNLSGKFYSIKWGTVSLTNSIVTDFNIYGNGVNTINTYQRAELAGMGMPSNKYLDLTLGASGSTYTAPANGWFCLIGPTEASGYIGNDISGITTSGTPVYGLNVRFQVRKGETVTILYTSATILRFIYAQGDQ